MMTTDEEPTFVLSGHDPCAWLLVDLWADLRVAIGEPAMSEPIVEARQRSRSMKQWAERLDKGRLDEARLALRRLLYGGNGEDR